MVRWAFCFAALGCAVVAAEQRLVQFDPSSGCCSFAAPSGIPTFRIADGPISISISLHSWEKYEVVFLSAALRGPGALVLRPSGVKFEYTEPRPKTLKLVDPWKKAAAIERSARASAAMQEMFGAVAAAGGAQKTATVQSTQSGTVEVRGQDGTTDRGTYSGTSTSSVTYTDEAEKERNMARVHASAQARLNSQLDKAGFWRDKAMPSPFGNAAVPTEGWLIFEKADRKARALRITVPFEHAVYQFDIPR